MDSVIWVVVVYLLIQMSLVWLVAVVIKNPSIIDVVWPVGLTVSGLIYLFSTEINFRLLVISIILIVWGLRLGGYLFFTRIMKGIVDKRYLTLSEGWKISKSLGYFFNFQLQGIFILIISGVFMFIAVQERSQLDLLDGLAIIICIIGIAGETLSDKQLQAFKMQNPGKVCNAGLWNYSRHPNYFFDWLTWCGFAMFGLKADYGYLVILSPLLLYSIMTKITGPMTEQGSIASRGDHYREYQKKTSMFFPWGKI